MASSEATLQQLRRSWGCDCDGESHMELPRTKGPRLAVLPMSDAIENLTGHRPHTCPWRVFYSELVRETIALASMADDGLGMALLGEDPPAILLDAYAVYSRARKLTAAADRESKNK